MRALQKIVWAEGVFLGQQHFQLWDSYLEQSQIKRVNAVSPFAWGIITLEIDESALLNSIFKVNACALIFPQGELIELVDQENLVCQLPSHSSLRPLLLFDSRFYENKALTYHSIYLRCAHFLSVQSNRLSQKTPY